MAIRILRTFFKGPVATGGNMVPAAVDPTLTPTAHTASATLVVADLNNIHTNTGAAASIGVTLPSAAASGADNTSLKIQMTAAQIVQLVPASGESIYLGGSGVADKYLQIAGVIGNYADLYCDGVKWMVTGYSGVLTKQP